ncbi:hypothetical protein E2C01_095531 [Portunus trituberculatus]|uniref:Uncharacterized protein n=1 Tax=Portunus trituberculatus TaxID=210409 RepID=A0A5B7JQ29_PORTR|nr:hypothetical protein [Portunus trituberculatus]
MSEGKRQCSSFSTFQCAVEPLVKSRVCSLHYNNKRLPHALCKIRPGPATLRQVGVNASSQFSAKHVEGSIKGGHRLAGGEAARQCLLKAGGTTAYQGAVSASQNS